MLTVGYLAFQRYRVFYIDALWIRKQDFYRCFHNLSLFSNSCPQLCVDVYAWVVSNCFLYVGLI